MKKYLAVLLALLVFTAALPMTAFAANGYDDDDDWEFDPEMARFISVYEYDEADPEHDAVSVYSQGVVNNEGIAGVTYDKETNTLTLDNYDGYDSQLFCGSMGESFKIVVKGECALAGITCSLYGDENWLDFEGDGTLTIGEAKTVNCPIRYINMFEAKSKLIFGEDVKVRLYGNPEGENRVVLMSYTAYTDADDAIVFNGSHSHDAQYDEEDMGQYKFISGCGMDFMDQLRGEYLGALVTDSEDPDGIYTASHYTRTDANGEQTGEGYSVNRYLWSDALGLYLYDASYNVSGSHGTRDMSVEEFENSSLEFVLDEYDDTVPLYNDRYITRGWRYRVSQDDEGNVYAVGEEYDFETGGYHPVVVTFEPIADVDGEYIFTEAEDVDPDDLEQIAGYAYINGYYIDDSSSYTYILGERVNNPADPEGIYAVSTMTMFDEDMNEINYYQVRRFIYDEAIGAYLHSALPEDNSLRMTEDQFIESGFTFVYDDNGGIEELHSKLDVAYWDWVAVYVDSEGAEYGRINYNGEWYYFTFSEIDGLDGTYWLTPADVDPEEMTELIEPGGEIVRTVWIEAEVFTYNMDEKVLLGDGDGDGDVTILDATAIQRYLAGLGNKTFHVNACDADGDGDVTILDATAIQRHLAGLPTNRKIGTYL